MTEKRTINDRIPRVLIVGAGDLAGQVLYQLAQDPRSALVVLAGRDEAQVQGKANLAKLAALQVGHDSDIRSMRLDLDDLDATAATIDEVRPDVIFSAVSLQSWWVIGTLPKPAFDRLYRANFGPWLPVHLAPVKRLMSAVREARSGATIINAAYPDAVHPALHGCGLSPDTGIGNVANNVPALRLIAAERLSVPVRKVRIRGRVPGLV